MTEVTSFRRAQLLPPAAPSGLPFLGHGADELTLFERTGAGSASVREIVGRAWPYILAIATFVGVLATGIFIVGFVSNALL